MNAFSDIIVGVADMQPVRELWVGHFGLEVVAEREGSDPALEALWGLPADSVSAQLLLGTPGALAGRLHFVQFAEPAAPVRSGAATTDLCPKNIDINCDDLPARVAELEAAGFRFRSAVSEYELDGITVREVQMAAHDDINVVLIEVPGWDMPMTAAGYGGVTSFVVTVPDTASEAAFYQQVFGHELLMHHRITGPEIEAVVGLPPGAALDMRLLGEPENLFGRVELITYEGINGNNLFPAARPPATGSLGARVSVRDLNGVLQRSRDAGITTTDHGVVDLLSCSGPLMSLSSPAGFAIEVIQLPD